MRLYQYPKCSTCRNAKRFLDEREIDYQAIDISVQPPTQDELVTMLDAADGNLRSLFNTSGMQYRELGIKDRIGDMDGREALQLLSSNGMLVKRPFLVGEGIALVGFREEAWSQALDG